MAHHTLAHLYTHSVVEAASRLHTSTYSADFRDSILHPYPNAWPLCYCVLPVSMNNYKGMGMLHLMPPSLSSPYVD